MQINRYSSFIHVIRREISSLIKMRLTLTVVFSASISFLIGSRIQGSIIWSNFFILSIASFLITSSANVLNEIIERESDKLMKRTLNRPLPAKRVTINEAIFLAIIMLTTGLIILTNLNFLSGFLSSLSIIIYAFVYTPLKKETRLAVFWGAIPGALPPLIGYFSSFESISINEISNNYIVMLIVPNLLFLSQFIWQFPHFWAIAWVFNSDYSSAGINLLPSKIKFISSQIMLLFTLTTILINFIPFLLGIGGYLYFTVSTIGGLLFLYVAYTHFIRQSDITAKKMMVISIIYLPILQLALLADISI